MATAQSQHTVAAQSQHSHSTATAQPRHSHSTPYRSKKPPMQRCLVSALETRDISTQAFRNHSHSTATAQPRSQPQPQHSHSTQSQHTAHSHSHSQTSACRTREQESNSDRRQWQIHATITSHHNTSQHRNIATSVLKLEGIRRKQTEAEGEYQACM